MTNEVLDSCKQEMDRTVVAYVIYLVVSIGLTVWVARTLSRNGRIFLADVLRGNESLADAVNHLLVVGFYLVNVGYITLALKYGEKPTDVQGAVEFLSTKVGLVLVVLGAMHFFNMMQPGNILKAVSGERIGTLVHGGR